MAKRLRGIVAAMVTPFDGDESLNVQGVREIVRFLVAKGIHGLFPGGSQGEFYSLSSDEQRLLLDETLAAAEGKVFTIAHVGAIATRDAVHMARYAERAGADAVTAITPFYISPTQQELYAYYADIAAATSLPVLAYNNPGRTHVGLLPETAAKLASDIPSFVGIKDSAGDLSLFAEFVRLCPPNFGAFVGRDSIIYAALNYGGVGAVAATANIVPDLIVGIYDAVQAQDYKQALRLQRLLSPLRAAFGLGTFPVVVKEAMVMLGLPAGPARSPISPLRSEARAKLRQVLSDMGALGEE